MYAYIGMSVCYMCIVSIVARKRNHNPWFDSQTSAMNAGCQASILWKIRKYS